MDLRKKINIDFALPDFEKPHVPNPNRRQSYDYNDMCTVTISVDMRYADALDKYISAAQRQYRDDICKIVEEISASLQAKFEEKLTEKIGQIVADRDKAFDEVKRVKIKNLKLASLLKKEIGARNPGYAAEIESKALLDIKKCDQTLDEIGDKPTEEIVKTNCNNFHRTAEKLCVETITKKPKRYRRPHRERNPKSNKVPRSAKND